MELGRVLSEEPKSKGDADDLAIRLERLRGENFSRRNVPLPPPSIIGDTEPSEETSRLTPSIARVVAQYFAEAKSSIDNLHLAIRVAKLKPTRDNILLTQKEFIELSSRMRRLGRLIPEELSEIQKKELIDLTERATQEQINALELPPLPHETSKPSWRDQYENERREFLKGLKEIREGARRLRGRSVEKVRAAGRSVSEQSRKALKLVGSTLTSLQGPPVIGEPRQETVLRGPTVSDLGSAFDKESSAILSRTGIGRSPEVSQVLRDKRDVQIRNSLGITYVSDMTGQTIPFFPEKVTDALLPFVLISNILVATTPNPIDGSPQMTAESLGRIVSIDSLLSLTIMMSDPRRLLADNLEATFNSSYHGYFVEPSGIKVLERIAKVISDIPTWTKKIASFSINNTTDSDRTYMERAMLSIMSVVTDYCAVSRPRAGGSCDFPTTFADNIARVAALRRMSDQALAAKSDSVFGRPLQALCTVIEALMANPKNVKIQHGKIDIKGELVKVPKEEGTAEERILKSIDTIHKYLAGVNHSNPNTLIERNLVVKIIDNLDAIVRDLTAVNNLISDKDRKDEMTEIINDLTQALEIIRNRIYGTGKTINIWAASSKKDNANFLDKRGFSSDEIAKIKQLYEDIDFVIRSKYKETDVVRIKEKTKTRLPLRGTKEFALKTPAMQTLPPGIDKVKLIDVLSEQNKLADNREWYDNLGKALQEVYGTQTTTKVIPYADIVKVIDTTLSRQQMEQAIIGIALPVLVQQLTGRDIPTRILDVRLLGQELYKDVQSVNLPINTEALGQAIADITPSLIALNIPINPSNAARLIADYANTRETALRQEDIYHALVTEAVASGIRHKVAVSPKELADAIQRVGETPPEWIRHALPTK